MYNTCHFKKNAGSSTEYSTVVAGTHLSIPHPPPPPPSFSTSPWFKLTWSTYAWSKSWSVSQNAGCGQVDSLSFTWCHKCCVYTLIQNGHGGNLWQSCQHISSWNACVCKDHCWSLWLCYCSFLYYAGRNTWSRRCTQICFYRPVSCTSAVDQSQYIWRNWKWQGAWRKRSFIQGVFVKTRFSLIGIG